MGNSVGQSRKQRQAIGSADPLGHLIPLNPSPAPVEKTVADRAGEGDFEETAAGVTSAAAEATTTAALALAPAAEVQRAPTETKKVKPAAKRKKVRATFHLPEELYDYVRDTVYALSGPGTEMTMTAFAERAIRAELKRLEKKHNNAEKFRPRSSYV